jgi:hypothetical protein
MWIFGAKLQGLSSILSSINFVVTILRMKHPDLSIMKMSLFAWAILIISIMILVSLPTFTAALVMLFTDRRGVSGFFNPNMGGDPVAYQRLFCFTFHPEVYIFFLPTMRLPAGMMVKKTLTDVSKSLTSSGDTNPMEEEMEFMRTKEDFGIENMEIASYKTLILPCQKLGVQDAIGPLQQRLKEEQDMANWISTNLPMTFDALWTRIEAAVAGIDKEWVGTGTSTSTAS